MSAPSAPCFVAPSVSKACVKCAEQRGQEFEATGIRCSWRVSRLPARHVPC